MLWAATSYINSERDKGMYSLLNTVATLAVLSLAISHMGWLITQSGIMRPLRERVSNITYTLDMSMLAYRLKLVQSVLAEGIGCIMCTITQLSLLLAWLLPDVIEGPAPIVYVIKAMMLAKVSLLVYDVGEWVGTLSMVDDTTDSGDGLPADAKASNGIPTIEYSI